MTTREDLSALSPDEIEAVEKLTLRWVFQAERHRDNMARRS